IVALAMPSKSVLLGATQLPCKEDHNRERGTMTSKPEIVIVGAGFGGLAAAKALENEPVNVTVLDRANHHLFQPLLYQVATAALSPAQMRQPIWRVRKVAATRRGAVADGSGVATADSGGIAREGRYKRGGRRLGTGARRSYFGRHEWETPAPGLKALDDAIE